MEKTILWLDNDPVLTMPYRNVLKANGYEVTPVVSITEAEFELANKRFDLIIVDAMIPTVSEEEERFYPPGVTDVGRQTGVVFYEKHKQQLLDVGTRTLVMTVRLDAQIRDAFLKAGLPEACYCTRLALRDVRVFSAKVAETLLASGPTV